MLFAPSVYFSPLSQVLFVSPCLCAHANVCVGHHKVSACHRSFQSTQRHAFEWLPLVIFIAHNSPDGIAVLFEAGWSCCIHAFVCIGTLSAAALWVPRCLPKAFPSLMGASWGYNILQVAFKAVDFTSGLGTLNSGSRGSGGLDSSFKRFSWRTCHLLEREVKRTVAFVRLDEGSVEGTTGSGMWSSCMAWSSVDIWEFKAFKDRSRRTRWLYLSMLHFCCSLG